MPRDFAVDVVRQLTQAGYLAYWAGGCVRDLLRGEEPNDFDVATSATPDQVRQVFGTRRTLAVGESFGVIIVLGPKGSGHQIEVATFRREKDYKDGRRPETVEFCSPEEDARRRDFTINGMFYDPLTGTVHDFVGGQADLRQRLVRAIGNPRDRMDEDKLRLLRAVRFATVLDFQLDTATAEAVSQMASQVIIVSAERIAQELRRMLTHPHRARAARLCADFNLLDVIMPEVREYTLRHSEQRWQQIQDLLAKLGNVPFEVAMAALLRDVPAAADRRERSAAQHGTVLSVCRRLKLSNEETDIICWLTARRGAFDDLASRPMADAKRLAVHPQFFELLRLERTAALIEGKSTAPFQWMETFLESTPPECINPPELLNGKDLLRLGYSQGPKFKIWLNAIREAQLNGDISTREQALEMLQHLATLPGPQAES